MGLLDGELASIIGQAAEFIFLNATLSRNDKPIGEDEGLSDPWNPTYGDPIEWSCKAIVEEWDVRFLNEGLVQVGDVKILVLANSLATEPKPLDKINVDGRGTFTVIPASQSPSRVSAVSIDPAKAVWTLRARA